MVCNTSQPIHSGWAANRGCRSDLQHRGGQRSRLQYSRAKWHESVAHSDIHSISESEYDREPGSEVNAGNALECRERRTPNSLEPIAHSRLRAIRELCKSLIQSNLPR